MIYHFYFSGILDICFRHLDEKHNADLNISDINIFQVESFSPVFNSTKNIDIFLDTWEYWIVLVFFPFDRIDS